MILGGDLGGTKTLLALAEPDRGCLNIIRQQRYASRDYPDFDALLADFLAHSPPVKAACFGVAGPIHDRRARLTYLPWQLDSPDLERKFAIGRVTLINDFAAAAHGLPLIEEQDILTLLPGQPRADAPRVILGAGTGLGVAGLIWQENRFQIIPGEGGHLGFAPQTPQQAELWRWLQAQTGRVTTEDVVSGPGLSRIYTFLSGRPQAEGNLSGEQAPEAIGDAAVNGTDPLASAALRLWLACYGAFAGDLAMLWLARGGVYLAGGIAAKLLPHINHAPLVDAFLAKREHSTLVNAMPLRLLTAEDLGLRGALAQARP